MGRKNNDALDRWHEARGHVRGRKWATQRLPSGMIAALRIMADKRGVGPCEIIEEAIRQSDMAREYETTLHPWATLVDVIGQQRLNLGGG